MPDLGPLAGALEAAADRDAEGLLAEARARAAERVAAAMVDVARIAAAADAQAAEICADAARTAAAEADRAARQAVLAAQRQALEGFTERAVAAVARAEPRGLQTEARALLGAGAEISRTADGGVLARSGRLVVDLSAHEVVRRWIADLGPEIETLWR